MKNRFWTIASITLLVALAFALTVSQSFAKGEDAATKAILALDKEWSDASLAHDVDKVASFYAEDARVYPPNDKLIIGRKAARDAWAQMLADPNFKTSWKTVSAAVDGNMAYTAGTYEMVGKTPDGKEVHDTGKTLCVWRKNKAGKWEAIHDMWNSDLK